MARLSRNVLCQVPGGLSCIRIVLAAMIAVIGAVGAAEAISPPVHPIVLVHGFWSGAETWDAFLDAVTNDGWTFGGQLTYRNGQLYYATGVRFGGPPRPADIYTINFSSSTDLTYLDQAFELEAVVEYVLAITGKSKVILVGHSMGGLAARAYLSYARQPKVNQIITVGTPHLGSSFATLGALLGVSAGVTAIRIMRPGSLELEQLNTDTLRRYRDTPIAYSSIIVDNDTVVSERSQSLVSTGLTVPLHNAVRILLNDACALSIFNHLCETADENVRIAITAEVVRRPVAFVLKAETPASGVGLPLRIKLLASSANRTGDLYLAVQTPSGSLFFQEAVGSGDLGWTQVVTPASRFLDGEELRTIDFDSLAAASTGEYFYYAVLARSGTNPYAGYWHSNLAQTSFVVEAAIRDMPRGRFIYVSSHRISGSRFEAPSQLWQVEVSAQGQDRLIGTIQTWWGFTPRITDLALTPRGELFGVSLDALYWINPLTAEAVPVGPVYLERTVGLASDYGGALFAATAADVFLGILFEPGYLYALGQSGGASQTLGALLGYGASGDIAFGPDGWLYAALITSDSTGDKLVVLGLGIDGRVVNQRIIGSLGRSGVFGLAFVGGELYGFTTDVDQASGSIIRINTATAAVEVVRKLNFQASGTSEYAGP